jgi:vancomycin resistance protein YoaR
MQKAYFIKVFTISILIIILLTSILLVPSFYDTFFSSKTVIGMSLFNTNIGGKTISEISKILDDEIAKPKKIKIAIQEKSIEINLNSAGLMIDKEKTIKKALTIGKKNFFEALKIKLLNAKIEPEINVDKNEFNQVIDSLLEKEGFIGKSFEYEIIKNTAKIKINPKLRKVDKEKLLNEIINTYSNLKDIYTAQISLPELPTALEIKNEIDLPVIDAKIEKINDATKITPHQIGINVNEQDIKDRLTNQELNFSVPIVILNPKVYTDDLGDSAFPSLLYKFSTYYNPREISRSQNVILATKKVNGTILNSGDIFSFNKVVGKRSYENGFQDAKIFLANKIIEDVGGGICQVSSTLYPAALYCDLKIIERKNHNFVVSYAKPGLDATVVFGAIDFKFQNTLKNPIKIRATATGGVMTISIFGTKENNNLIELSTNILSETVNKSEYEYNKDLNNGETKIKQKGSNGLKVNAFRIVKDSSGAIIRTDNLGLSNYVPLAKIIETGDISLTKSKENNTTPQIQPTKSPIPSENPIETPTPTIEPTPATESTPTPSEIPIETPTPTQDKLN